MKTILVFALLFAAIAVPARGELTDADLDKIRLIVNDSEKRLNVIISDSEKRIRDEFKTEIAKTHTKIDALDTRLRTLETGVAELRGSSIAFSLMMDWIVPLCAVAALIISIVALTQKQPANSPLPQDIQEAVSQ